MHICACARNIAIYPFVVYCDIFVLLLNFLFDILLLVC